MVTTQDARQLAKTIQSNSSAVQDVELFGSVATNGQGRDIDLMLIVAPELSEEFWSITADTIPQLPARLLWLRRVAKTIVPFLDHALTRKRKQSRQLRVSKLIGLDLDLLGETYRPGTSIDPWLVPPGWHFHINEITNNTNMRALLQQAANAVIKLT